MYHVHDILHLVKDKAEGFQPNDLVDLLVEQFGPEARFTTCGNHCLDHQEAIDFVLMREKVLLKDGRILINPGIESC
jgi:probable metal-binding protein